SFLQSEPLLPRAHHAIAKGYYYELLSSGFQLSNQKLLKFLTDDGFSGKDFEEYSSPLEGMYRNALRAMVFQPDFPESSSNRLLVLLYQALEGRKDPGLILGELAFVEYERLTPELRPVYI